MGSPVKYMVTDGGHISKDIIYKNGQNNTILNGGSNSSITHKQLG